MKHWFIEMINHVSAVQSNLEQNETFKFHNSPSEVTVMMDVKEQVTVITCRLVGGRTEVRLQ